MKFGKAACAPLFVCMLLLSLVVSGCATGAPATATAAPTAAPEASPTPEVAATAEPAATVAGDAVSPVPATAGDAASPVATPGDAVSPLPEPTQAVTLGEPLILPAGFDLKRVALTPEDMKDLFEVSYSIEQGYDRPGMRGMQVMYPTEAILHVTDFAQGFMTRVEVYDTVAAAHEAFTAASAGSGGEVLPIKTDADASYVELNALNSKNEPVAPDSPDAKRFIHEIGVRKANVLLLLTIKTTRPLEVGRLEQAAATVLGRLG